MRRWLPRCWGLGPLQPCLDDETVTDVLVNGDGSVWLDRGAGLERSDVSLSDAGSARRLAVRLAGLAGRRLDESQPWVDGLLPGGLRLHAMLPPLVDGGAHVSLRVPRVRSDGLAALRERGMFDEPMSGVLRALVARRCSFLVTGGTGCGKTTVLAAMLARCRPASASSWSRTCASCRCTHPHVVRLQGRGANVEGQGAVTLVDLVRQALRMRPDRLVVGEVRGAEVREMLAALNTGHEGGCGTVHANAAADVPARLEALGALAGLAREAVATQASSALQAVVHVTRDQGLRHVQSVSVMRPGSRGVQCVPAYEHPGGPASQGWRPVASPGGRPG